MHIRAQPLNRTPADADEDFAPSGYTLVFDEDFTTFTANSGGNGETTWRTTYFNGGRQADTTRQIYTDAAYTGTGGTPLGMDPFEQVSPRGLKIWLDLTTTEQKASLPNLVSTGLPPEYWSGILTSPFFFAPVLGFWAARIKAPVNTTGLFPAVWMAETFGTDYEEIDWFENVNSDGTNHCAMHTDSGQVFRARPRIIPDGWNVYGCLRTVQGVQWFLNGLPVGRITRAPLLALPSLINFAVNSNDVGNEGLLPQALEIDWFRFYEPPLDWPGGTLVLEGISGAVSEWDGENSAKTGDPIVTQWNDLIGTNHATKATGGDVTRVTIGGRTALDFTGARFDAGSITLPAPSAGGATLLAVVQPDVTNAFMQVIGFGASSFSGVAGVSLGFNNAGKIRGAIADGVADRVTLDFGNYAADTPIILQLSYNAGFLTVKRNNGRPMRLAHSLENNIAGLELGFGRALTTASWDLNGKIMWAGYCTGVLSDLAMEIVARRLNSRFSVY